jgi:AbrB family looped-hinge helix DNA binding protein
VVTSGSVRVTLPAGPVSLGDLGWLSRTRLGGDARHPYSAETSDWECAGIVLPMETTVDSVGRIVVPKAIRDALGLLPGSTVDITVYGAGLQVVPAGRTARVVEIDGALLADSDTPVTDDVVFGLIDTLRR